MLEMKPAHDDDCAGTTPPRNPAGPGRMWESFQGRGTPLPDAVRAFSSIEGPGDLLRVGARREKCAAHALYGHWPTPARAGARGAATSRRGRTRRCAARARSRRTPAYCGAMPQLFRLADAGNGCLSITVARS